MGRHAGCGRRAGLHPAVSESTSRRRDYIPPYRRRLVIFAKQPVLGAVKSRLAADIGWTDATRWYRAHLERLVRRLAGDPRWRTIVALAPDRAMASPHLIFRRMNVAGVAAQGPGDLGVRMGRVLRQAAPGPVIIVGSDIPAIRPAHIEAAFRALGAEDYVFGPAADGGYWLVGAKGLRRDRGLFDHVRWSTAFALADTLANIEGGRSVAFVETLRDVDAAGDL